MPALLRSRGSGQRWTAQSPSTRTGLVHDDRVWAGAVQGSLLQWLHGLLGRCGVSGDQHGVADAVVMREGLLIYCHNTPLLSAQMTLRSLEVSPQARRDSLSLLPQVGSKGAHRLRCRLSHFASRAADVFKHFVGRLRSRINFMYKALRASDILRIYRKKELTGAATLSDGHTDLAY